MDEKKITVSLPYDVWKNLKLKAISSDMTLKDYVIKVLKENS